MVDTTTKQLFVTSADGTRIAVNVTGEGPPLVVSPGSLSVPQDWQLVADALAPQMTTYAIDRRGHGASSDNQSYDIKREQEDVAAVLDLAGDGATLLGHSYGAVVALGLALELPPAQLIVYEPPLPLDGPVAGAALEACEQAVADGDLDLALTIGLREFVRVPEEGIGPFRQHPEWAVRASQVPGWIRELKATDAFGDGLDRFAKLKIPTLMIVGAVSPPWLVDVSRRLHGAVPGSRFVEIPGQAHDAHVLDPQAMAATIVEFAL